MNALLRSTIVVFLALTVVTGLAYPLAIAGVAQLLFPFQANGSIMMVGGRAVGSHLIGQPFNDPKYLWGRPSSTAPYPYNAASSSGSNLGPTNPALTKDIADRVAALRAADPGNPATIPVDLVTASASGLDPDISPAAAAYQVARIARARGVDSSTVRGAVVRCTAPRQYGFLGEPRVNVLCVNLMLDGVSSRPDR